VFLRYISLFFT